MFRRLLVVLLLAVSLHAQERRTFTFQFHSAGRFILLDTTLDGKPSVLMLDTGAPISFTLDSDGIAFSASKGFRTTSTVYTAYYKPPIKFNGVVGQDILRKFSSVRIDYKAQTVTLEE